MNLFGIFTHCIPNLFLGIIDGGSAGAAVSAGLYVASNIFSWSEARKMPDRQADANTKVLNLQKTHYDGITATQRQKLSAAIGDYVGRTDSIFGGGEFEAAMPDVPLAAEYIPVDAGNTQSFAIEQNIRSVDRSDAYVRYVNRQNEQNDLIRGLSFNAGFLVDLDILNKSIQDMMRGILAIGDVIDVVSDQAEMAAFTGRIGSVRKTTARDLGISKMRMQAAGREEFRRNTQFYNTVVSPQGRQHDIAEMMMAPGAQIELALAQAQLIQNSLQNKNNALAQKEPYLLARLQARMQRDITLLQAKSAEALLTNNFVPNFSSIVVPKLDNVSGLVGAIGQGISKANSSHFVGPPNQNGQDGYDGSRTGSYAPTK